MSDEKSVEDRIVERLTEFTTDLRKAAIRCGDVASFKGTLDRRNMWADRMRRAADEIEALRAQLATRSEREAAWMVLEGLVPDGDVWVSIERCYPDARKWAVIRSEMQIGGVESWEGNSLIEAVRAAGGGG